MKHVNVKNWMMTLLLAGACCGFVACDDNDDEKTPPTGPTAATVIGTYQGTMNIVEAASEAEGEEPTGTPFTAIVTASEIQMNDFPIRTLVARIVGEENADAIVAMIGKVDYAVPYVAVVSEDKATIDMPLQPAPLKLTLTMPEAQEGESQSLEIEVTITAETTGTYTVESGRMGFKLAAEGVSLNGTPLEGFQGFTLGFEMQQTE